MHTLANLSRAERIRRNMRLSHESLWSGHIGRMIYERRLVR